MTTTNTYNSITTWSGSEVHLKDIDIGPRGDNLHGYASITGDKWNHNRVGYVTAPFAKLLDDVYSSPNVPCYQNPSSGNTIYVTTTDLFSVGDLVFVRDDDTPAGEVKEINNITSGESITISGTLDGTYTIGENMLVSKIVTIKVEKNENITTDFEGDWFAINGECPYEIYGIIKDPDTLGYDYIKTYFLKRDYSKGDMLAIFNTNSGWSRDSKNPIIGLQRKKWYDYAGQGSKTPEIYLGADILKDSEDAILETKNAIWVTSERENNDSQISLLLSKDEGDIYNWTDFLGDKNSARPNPIIRHSYVQDEFDYVDADELKKVWDTEDGDITLDVVVDGSSCMEITCTDDGEVVGLMPTPTDFNVLTNGADTFSFYYKGDGHASGDLYIIITASDGTTTGHTFTNALHTSAWTHGSFSFATKADGSAFNGKKYVKSITIGIDCGSPNVVLIDTVHPFMPPRKDEIIEDPTIVAGVGDGEGLFACYYTMRERPRQILTVNASLDGSSNGDIGVSDTSDFDAGDTIIIYDRTNYEVAKIVSVVSGTTLTVENYGASEDGISEFEFDYNINNQAMVANNTYRVNKIGGAYIYAKDANENIDLSQWGKYPTNESPSDILAPSGTVADWDSLSVKQPCVKVINNKVYMAYVGCSLGNTESIGFATSSNYVDFTKSEKNPLLEPSGGKFDSGGCFHPDIILKDNYCFMNYTGNDGTIDTIGSAYFENDFNTSYPTYHVSVLVFPVGYKSGDSTYTGYPQKKVTLYDQGNFRIDVDTENRLIASAYVNGEEITSSQDSSDDLSMDNGFGTTLIHNHWNLVIAQYNKGEVSIHNVKLCPKYNSAVPFENFTRSPWRLTEDLDPGDSTITIVGTTNIVDTPIADQDYMLFGYGLQDDGGGGYEQSLKTHHQIGRIISVTDNGDDTYDLELDYPIGAWGFSSNNWEDSDFGEQGIMLAQGASYADLATWTTDAGYQIFASTPSNDGNNIFEPFEVKSKDMYGGSQGTYEEGYWTLNEDKIQGEEYRLPVMGIPLEIRDPKIWNSLSDFGKSLYDYHPPRWNDSPLLDPDKIRPPILGNSQNLKRGWNCGYIAYADISTDWLHYDNSYYENSGGRINLFAQMINGSQSALYNPKPQWHEFDLTGTGSLPTIYYGVSGWDAADYDGEKIPDRVDSTDGNHMYLLGVVGTSDQGFLGGTVSIDHKENDALATEFFNEAFTKINGGDEQISEGSSGRWDDSGVSGCHQFKFNDKFWISYTGSGRVPFQAYGEIIGDLFETSLETYCDNDVSFTIDTNIPAGCTIEIYMNWKKKEKWVKLWESDSNGDVTIDESFSKEDGETELGDDITDFKYNVKWKLKLLSNDPTLDTTPTVRSLSVEYTDPGSCPSEQFLAEQDKYPEDRRPVYRVILWRNDTEAIVDITSKIKKGGISNLTYEIPVEPNKLSNIIASDVSITVDNHDLYFSENDTDSIFYDRNYLKDEIRIYAGFKTDDSETASLAGEFEVSGRFLINKVIIQSTGEAVIECRSLLRAALDTIIGYDVDGEEDALKLDGNVKDIMEDLLNNNTDADDKTIGANIAIENIYIENYDREFGNIFIRNMTVGQVLQKLAQACDGIVYTNNQGDIYFKTWDNLTSGTYEINKYVNLKNAKYVGQDYDRLVKKSIVKGLNLVHSISQSETLDIGRDIEISNDFIQKQDWADDIADNIISRYGLNESEVDLSTIYLPSINILDTIEVTDAVSGITEKKYLVHHIVKNITQYNDNYKLISNLAVE